MTSPRTICSPSSARAPTVTTASPVLTATRAEPPSDSMIARPARTARSGSSSWVAGAPKTATTASPMYFSIVPPCPSSASRMRSSWGRIAAPNSSGSCSEPVAVEPTMSAKSTVTTLRSSPAGAETAAPQDAQNRAAAVSSAPQERQTAMSTKKGRAAGRRALAASPSRAWSRAGKDRVRVEAQSSCSPEDRGEERRSDEELDRPTLPAGLDRGPGRGRDSRGEPPGHVAGQRILQVLQRPDLPAHGIDDGGRQAGRLRHRHGECDREALEGEGEVPADGIRRTAA